MVPFLLLVLVLSLNIFEGNGKKYSLRSKQKQYKVETIDREKSGREGTDYQLAGSTYLNLNPPFLAVETTSF